jgi:hypothetical protein
MDKRSKNGRLVVLHRYSRIRVDVLEGTSVKWLFPQEKATTNDLSMGTVTLILL